MRENIQLQLLLWKSCKEKKAFLLPQDHQRRERELEELLELKQFKNSKGTAGRKETKERNPPDRESRNIHLLC